MRLVASDVRRAELGAALARRGLLLAPLPSNSGSADIAAWLIGWQRRDGSASVIVDRVRSTGWRGPLMLLGSDGAAIADALDAGADDAALADAPLPEIAARLAARLRGATLCVGDLTLDPARRTASRGGRDLNLLPREFAVLHYLADRAGHTISRGELLDAIWGLRFDPGTNVVAVQISRLRARIDAAGPPMLHTDRGRGYRLAP